MLGVIAVLAGGWPLISGTIAGSHPSAAGEVLTIGPRGSGSAQFTPGPGWVISTADSDPAQGWRLQHGPVEVSLLYVMLLSPGQASRLWPGLRQLVRLGGSSARLGQPSALAGSPGGYPGQTGPVTDSGRDGQAVVIADPGGDFAVEVITLAPAADAAAARSTAAQVASALQFPGAAA